MTFAEWPKTESVTVRRPKRFPLWPVGVLERTVEKRTEEFCPDYYDYPAPECCAEEFTRKLDDGFTQLYSITFGGLTSIALARREPDNKIALADVPRVFTPGQALRLDEFSQYFRGIGLMPTATTGRLSTLLGPATAL